MVPRLFLWLAFGTGGAIPAAEAPLPGDAPVGPELRSDLENTFLALGGAMRKRDWPRLEDSASPRLLASWRRAVAVENDPDIGIFEIARGELEDWGFRLEPEFSRFRGGTTDETDGSPTAAVLVYLDLRELGAATGGAAYEREGDASGSDGLQWLLFHWLRFRRVEDGAHPGWRFDGGDWMAKPGDFLADEAGLEDWRRLRLDLGLAPLPWTDGGEPVD